MAIKRWHITWSAWLGVLASVAAHAQPLPSTVDPGRVQPPTKPQSSLFDVKPTRRAAPAAAAVASTHMAPFTLHRVSVHGATAFPEAELRALYEDRLERTVTDEEVQGIVAAVRAHYMDAGFSITDVALKTVDAHTGTLTMDVIEGHVVEVHLDPQIKATPLVQAFVAEVTAMKPLNTLKLERLMLVLNARPSLSVASVLAPAKHAAGERGALALTLQPKPNGALNSFVSIDNEGSNFTGPVQLTAGTTITDLGLNNDDLFLSGSMTSKVQEMKQASAQYTLPVFGVSGTTLQLSGTVNGTEPGGRLDTLDVKGRAHTLGAQLEYPILLQRDENWFVSAGFTYKNIRTDILGARLFDDRLRIANLASRYSFADRLGGLNRVQVEVSKGLNMLGVRASGSPDLSRRDGRSDFTKFEASVNRLQPLGAGFDLLASARGQQTPDPLLSSEEFGIGGASMGRGYDASEITGDRGYAASLELRYTTSPDGWGMALQPYGFYDVGKVFNIDPSDKNHRSIASTGAGMRFFTDMGWSVDANAALPLTKRVDEPPYYANQNSPRFLVSVKRAF